MFGMSGGGTQTQQAQAQGSGFVISPDGYIVTNDHVITAGGQGLADTVTVKMADGTEYSAKIVGRDTASDIAVLKITPGKTLPFVKFGESSKARAGDWVIAIGNPFGLGGSVTAGIISAVYRNTGAGAYDHYIQTDASINSGNSGGPMFDMKGNVIGINNWIIAPSGGNIGIGFAIPSDIAAPIVEKLRSGAAIERGYLGVVVEPVDDDLADSLGLQHDHGGFVQRVEPGQGAAKAGLMAGDVVTKVDGKLVTQEQTLSFIVANIPPGKRITIELNREGQSKTVTAVVGKRPTDEELAQQAYDPRKGAQQGKAPRSPVPQAATPSLIEKSLGISAIPLTPQIAARLGVSEDTQGLVITGVDTSSDAATKKLTGGIIILSANYRPVTTLAALEAQVRAAKAAGREAILLKLQPPGSQAVYIPIRLR
jgi:serine protease Do